MRYATHIAAAIVCALPLIADGQTEKADSSESNSEIVASYPIKIGLDAYSTLSGMEGQRRGSDGLWAGYGAAYPSTASISYDNGRGTEGKLALGIGGMYRSQGTPLRQPVELWWKAPISGAGLTVGKFWVPFGAQEWEYETKPGIMLSWERAGTQVAVSANHTRETGAGALYARIGRQITDSASVGISMGAGRGLSYGSSHDRAWALDGSAEFGGFSGYAEYTGLSAGAQGRHYFYGGRLAYERLGNWKPFVAAYSWNDPAGDFGRFRSSVYGVTVRVTPFLEIETATAATSNGRVPWFQLHWTMQR